MSKEAYLLGRIQPILEKIAESNTNYLKMLNLQKEKGSEWKETPKSPEQLDKLIDWKMKETTEIVEVLDILCETFGICSSNKKEVNAEEEAMLQYLRNNEEIKKKLLARMDKKDA